jgi:hypothetical protein
MLYRQLTEALRAELSTKHSIITTYHAAEGESVSYPVCALLRPCNYNTATSFTATSCFMEENALLDSMKGGHFRYSFFLREGLQ